MKNRRIIITVLGVLLLVLGVSSIICGGAILFFNQGTDEGGFALSNTYEVRSSTNAFVLWVAPLQLPSYLRWMNHEDIVETKWIVEASNPDEELFAGWTREDDGQYYLWGFTYETPLSWNWRIAPYSAEIEIPQTAIYGEGVPERPPSEETFWLYSAHSEDTLTLIWDPVWDREQMGRNILIVMNLDGLSNVEADIQLGFRVPIFSWLHFLLLSLGVVLSISGILLIRRRKQNVAH